MSRVCKTQLPFSFALIFHPQSFQCCQKIFRQRHFKQIQNPRREKSSSGGGH